MDVKPSTTLTPDEIDALDLDVRGVLDGGDKSSVRGDIPCSWDYYRHYAQAFSRFRDASINVIEIGVAGGSSLKTWGGYFRSATLVGIDIDPACAKLERGPLKVRIGSQDDEQFLTDVVKEFPPTIIIDDGSHQAQHIIKSFEVLFPSLLSGGLYVVEDLAFHFEDNGAKVEPSTHGTGEPVFHYFTRLLAAKAAHVTSLRDAGDKLNTIYAEIDEITVAGGMLIVKKRAHKDWSLHVPFFEQQLRVRAEHGVEQYRYALLRYAEFLMTYKVNIPRAVDLLKEALSTAPGNRRVIVFLVAALRANGQPEEAKRIAAENGLAESDLKLPIIHCPTYMRYPH
ncbi:hypothetical protein FBZ98_1011049 [Rhizobium sp. ERR 922]|nr:hypothetical protein FBZ98_1011049 [Rhizobium sp. ERR 922]TWC04630.1 hypothetical protein FBZ97_1011049 [Rhizobium sp. ERR 942]